MRLGAVLAQTKQGQPCRKEKSLNLTAQKNKSRPRDLRCSSLEEIGVVAGSYTINPSVGAAGSPFVNSNSGDYPDPK